MRILRWAVVGIVALGVGLGGLAAALLLWSLPPARLRAALPGLAAEVSITLDAYGIPRIHAESDRDAAAALGFMHARDRMFQMDLMRRAASGRLSEIAGVATLRLDRIMRTLGLRRRAEADLTGLDADTRTALDGYAQGVNAWIALRGRLAAPEFIVLGAPEPWTPVDSLLWGKTMGLYLSGNWRGDLARPALQEKLPADRIWPPQDRTPRPDATALAAAAARLARAVPAFPEPFTLPGSASNEWAVDGAHSESGAPLLAGDPHLAYTMPGIWYLARIQTPSGVLAGATAPGMPFLVMGHNGRIAWTFTTTGADTQDVFVETVLPDGTYATPDGPKPFVTHEERIGVRGQADDVLIVRETRHGPVLSDLDPVLGSPVMAVSMANLQPGDASPGLLALNRAANVDAAGQAAERIVAPVQNLLVADRARIALFTTGRIPIRRSGDGSVPASGADGVHDWTGFAQGAALPRVVAPASGRLVNANERTAGPDFPVFMGRDWFGDWRARRIRTLLAGTEKHSALGFAAMQVDAGSSFAAAVLPTLLATEPVNDASRRALALLRAWDGAMRTDLAQPLIFNTWVRQIEAEALRRAGVPDARPGLPSDFVARMLSPEGAAWCGGPCGPVLTVSLAATVAELAVQHGTGWESVLWGSVHQAIFAHPLLGQLPLLGRLTTWRIEQPGDDTTVYRGTPGAGGWGSVHGPGYRGVYDLADLDLSLFAATPGQSGHLLRRTATSLMQRWRDGAPVRLRPEADIVADTVGLHP